MADHTTRAVLDQLVAQQERLATLEQRLGAQEAELAWHRKRRRYGRSPRRLIPLILAALLVALVSVATLAANPFADLVPDSPHNGNIDAIYNAGITTGCAPTEYCPTRNVTREEMASFLARAAGLGSNPPIANARTAQSAASAQTAQSAVTAQTATNANSAATAGNANTVGGYAPADLNRVAFTSTRLTSALPGSRHTDLMRVRVNIPGPAPQAVVVRGAFNAFGQTSGSFIYTTIRQDGTANTIGSGRLDFPFLTNSLFIGISAHAEWVFVAPPGDHTYTLVAFGNGTGDLTIDRGHLVATTHPFGPGGSPGATAIDPAPDGEQPTP